MSLDELFESTIFFFFWIVNNKN